MARFLRAGIVALATLLVTALAGPAAAATTIVFDTRGEISVLHCSTCHFLLDIVDDRVPLDVPDPRGDGIETDTVEGALQHGGNYFTLTIHSQSTPGSDIAITFYNAGGVPIARFDRLGPEMGWVPDGAAIAIVDLKLGTQVEYDYVELLRT